MALHNDKTALVEQYCPRLSSEYRATPQLSAADVQRIIVEEAQNANLDARCMLRLAELESNVNNRAVNTTRLKSGRASCAGGVYQIMPFHNVNNVFDARQNIRWAMQFTKQNHEYLRAAGIPINCATTYLCHQQGAFGAATIWRAMQEGKRIDELPPDIQRNIAANDGGNEFTTAEQFVRFWQRKVDKSPLNIFSDSTQRRLAHLSGTHLSAIGLLGAAAIGIGVVHVFLDNKSLKNQA